MATQEPQSDDAATSSNASPDEAAPPVVGDSAVSSSPATPPDDSAKNEDPHPDGITTEDVAATENQSAASSDEEETVTPVPPTPDGTADTSQTDDLESIPGPDLRQGSSTSLDPSMGLDVTTPASLDPALSDPVETAKARVEGRTSDASLRSVDGPHIDQVPADVTDGPKPSDGGAEVYPFPQGGDVDVATVPDGDQEGEYYPQLTIEDSVILLEHELVPERLVGRRAFIIEAPQFLVPISDKDKIWITVRTRDEANATLNIPLGAVDVKRGATDPTVRG